MRLTRPAALCAAAVLALGGLTVPAVAYAGDLIPDVTPEPLSIAADVAADVQLALGRPTDFPLCGVQVPVLYHLTDGDRDAHVLFCVDADVAAEVQAQLAAE